MSIETKLLKIVSHRLVDGEVELLIKLPAFSTAKWLPQQTVTLLGVHEEQVVARYLQDPRNQVSRKTRHYGDV
jgi:hypothetical protein